MKKIYFIGFITILSHSISTSQNCKPAIKATDEFTEQEVIGWGGTLGSSRSSFQGVSQNLKFYIGSLDGKMFAEISVQYMQKGLDASVNTIDIPKGSQFMLKTEEGIITFTSIDNQKKRTKMSGYLVTAISLTAELTQEQLEILAKSPISMYRIEPEDSEPIKGYVKDKKAEKLLEQFQCFLNNN
ncbi:MAG: hypothetical protein KDD18_02850 [Mangrovimonas sp.]|nr:hypothetical protein [Mangrovimonas sp.]MCB0745831.1 hypothetical protein [Ignavibacteriota bacterium]